MKYSKFIMAAALLMTCLTAFSCTDEFTWTVPPKWEPKPDPGIESYDLTMENFLSEMVSFEEQAKFPAVAYKCCQESSRDRRSTTPGTPEWFANDDGWGFVRDEVNEGRQERVIFEQTGPGVIVRMWTTSFQAPTVVLRFYFDGAEKPSWEIPSLDLQQICSSLGKEWRTYLKSGLSQPGSEWVRGSSLYLPIPYAQGCKITLEEQDNSLNNPSRYYQINYRSYPENTKIETFSAKVLQRVQKQVAEVNRTLQSPSVKMSGRLVTGSATLAPGATLAVDLPAGSRAVSETKITVVTPEGGDYAQIMSDMIFTAEFDGMRTVAVPLADFSGAGPGAATVKSWLLSSDGAGAVVSRWPMPYKSSGRMVIRNTGISQAEVKLAVRVDTYTWDERTLYFHAAWKKADGQRIIYWSDYANGYDWGFASITGGRGVLRGDVYAINNQTHNWPGEGDEKIWVDDETFPSHFGTGVEDYYSFCGDFRYMSPFSGESRLDAPDFHGFNNHHRQRCLDGIPFGSKLRFDLEMEGHEAGRADLVSTVVWYGDLQTKAEGAEEFKF